MIPAWHADSVLLLERGPGFEHWLVLANTRADQLELPSALALQVVARATQDELLAQDLRDFLREFAGTSATLPALDPWPELESLLHSGRLLVVERARALPDIRSDGPMLELAVEPPPVSEPEPILLDDAPSLTRFVELVVLDFGGDGDPIVNLPLFVDHRRGSVEAVKTDGSGKIKVENLPADHSWSLFSAQNPDA